MSDSIIDSESNYWCTNVAWQMNLNFPSEGEHVIFLEYCNFTKHNFVRAVLSRLLKGLIQEAMIILVMERN